jgi:ABC-type nitrate/sulfonate/bicarbonate transport system substrate-binding protein
MRLPLLLAVAALGLALAGCNANETPNASTRTAYGASSTDNFNPINYAQTSGFYAGR